MMDVLIMDSQTAQGFAMDTAGSEHELSPREMPDGYFALPTRVLEDVAFVNLHDRLTALPVARIDPTTVWPDSVVPD